MFPLKDDNPTMRRPILTVLLIAVNIAVFLAEIGPWHAAVGEVVARFGLVPARLTSGEPGALLTLFSSQFLHGGFLHLGGNMLYLWIFGNNIEDHLGRRAFLPFYLACGASAGLAQAIANPQSTVPTIGASGAVAGVLGAYALLFPRARVHTLVFVLLFIRIIPVPAALWLGIWFFIQIFAAVLDRTQEGGGVAWFAHLGGFAVGFLAVRFLAPRARRPVDGMFGGARWLR